MHSQLCGLDCPLSPWRPSPLAVWTCKWPEEEGEGRRGLPQAQVTKGLGQAWGARCLPGQEKDFLRWKLTSCSGDPLEGLMPFSFFKPG